MINLQDTIAAISTTIGSGGIGIVRMSGRDALIIADSVFKGKTPSSMPSHTIAHGYIRDGDNIVDEVLLTVMRAPKTYTVEDIVEINCHGGLLMVRQILDLLIRNGARLADAGEFTMRAFLNGRIDLIAAEAVADIINAKTVESGKIAVRQLHDVTQVIDGLRAQLLSLSSYIEAYIDFPDEDIDNINIKSRIDIISDNIKALIDTYNTGRFFREGLSIAITGRPNVGKSSLLNVLLSRNRAIVTEFPGTTRDTLEEMININGIPVRLIDTAGIRQSVDQIEREGVKRSLDVIKEADIVILLFDGSQTITNEDMDMINITKSLNVIYVINKSDLPQLFDYGVINNNSIKISAKNSLGLIEFKEAITNKISPKTTSPTADFGIIITNIRHFNALKCSLDSLLKRDPLLNDNSPLEIIAIDIRESMEHLSVLMGEVTTDEILNNIFSEFCIGK